MIARVRSAVGAALVIASGASPIAMGALIDLGVPLSVQAGFGAFYMLAASILASRIGGRAK